MVFPTSPEDPPPPPRQRRTARTLDHPRSERDSSVRSTRRHSPTTSSSSSHQRTTVAPTANTGRTTPTTTALTTIATTTANTETAEDEVPTSWSWKESVQRFFFPTDPSPEEGADDEEDDRGGGSAHPKISGDFDRSSTPSSLSWSQPVTRSSIPPVAPFFSPHPPPPPPHLLLHPTSRSPSTVGDEQHLPMMKKKNRVVTLPPGRPGGPDPSEDPHRPTGRPFSPPPLAAAWEADREFPIKEIERIKNKTKRLRRRRQDQNRPNQQEGQQQQPDQQHHDDDDDDDDEAYHHHALGDPEKDEDGVAWDVHHPSRSWPISLTQPPASSADPALSSPSSSRALSSGSWVPQLVSGATGTPAQPTQYRASNHPWPRPPHHHQQQQQQQQQQHHDRLDDADRPFSPSQHHRHDPGAADDPQDHSDQGSVWSGRSVRLKERTHVWHDSGTPQPPPAHHPPRYPPYYYTDDYSPTTTASASTTTTTPPSGVGSSTSSPVPRGPTGAVTMRRASRGGGGSNNTTTSSSPLLPPRPQPRTSSQSSYPKKIMTAGSMRTVDVLNISQGSLTQLMNETSEDPSSSSSSNHHQQQPEEEEEDGEIKTFHRSSSSSSRPQPPTATNHARSGEVVQRAQDALLQGFQRSGRPSSRRNHPNPKEQHDNDDDDGDEDEDDEIQYALPFLPPRASKSKSGRQHRVQSRHRNQQEPPSPEQDEDDDDDEEVQAGNGKKDPSRTSGREGKDSKRRLTYSQQLEEGESHPEGNDGDDKGADKGVQPSGQDDGELSEEVSKCLALHDLCGEASSTDDIAWRNALFLLSVQPLLASISDDPAGWTPLHICCLGTSPPPSFIIHALLYAYPHAARLCDEGGRLPLHLVAASSADVSTMQVLLDEYPAAICQLDAHGLTPLQLLLRNPSVEPTVERIRVLLGLDMLTRNNQAETTNHVEWQRTVLQRRGEHLDLPVSHLKRLLKGNQIRPATNLVDRDVHLEAVIKSFPMDVQMAFRKLAQWKKRQRGYKRKRRSSKTTAAKKASEDGEDDAMLNDSTFFELTEETNPAAIAAPLSLQLPIHSFLHRTILNNTRRDDASVSDDKKEQQPKVEDEIELDDDDEFDPKEVSSFDMETAQSRNDVFEVLRVLANAYPKGLIHLDANGLTPLWTVMQTPNPNLDLIELLLGKRLPGFEPLPPWAEQLPFHGLKAAVGMLNPAMIPTRNTGQLPLHFAAEEFLNNIPVLETIHDSYPAAILVQDFRGCTPLHLALRNYQKQVADPLVVDLLYSDRVAKIRDDKSLLPVDLLLESGRHVPRKEPGDWYLGNKSHNAKNHSWNVYQRLFRASLASQTDSLSFLFRLRNLPPWLRQEACSSHVLQALLLEQLAGPWAFYMIFCDGILLVSLVTIFRVQTTDYVSTLRSPEQQLSSWYTYSVYSIATLRLLVQISFNWVSSFRREFRNGLLDYFKWIDATAMIFAVVTSASLYGSFSESALLAMSTGCTGLLWLTVVIYISTWCHGMAIFVGGFLELSSSLFWPFVTAGAVVVAFAQMIFTWLQADCSGSIPLTTVCRVRDSYRIVYLLLRGEPLVDLNGSSMSYEAIVLVALFLVCVAAFVIMVLILLLVGSKRLDYHNLSMEYFWKPKLEFVLAINEIGGLFKEANSGPVERQLEQTWEVMTTCLLGGRDERDKLWYRRSMRSIILNWIVGMAALVILPVWLVVGGVTVGLLWPPQVRRWVFRTERACYEGRDRTENLIDRKGTTDLRYDIMQLKLMSMERSATVEEQIRELRKVLSSDGGR